jgi:cation diffusion facilitator CzcD-associated flavoprotein CzcO
VTTEHVDVLIVGAGLSGIGTACHLQRDCPEKSYLILEGRDTIGGTWDLFRYPGIRSDSDMFTLGYSFKPWASPQSIADGPDILDYVRETAREYGVDRRIRFGHQVLRAEWSTETARWTVAAQRAEDPGETVVFTCSWLSVCSGYYRYDEGFSPVIPGADDFEGQIVHPQHWPADLDYAGRRVVVIGSGATAVTLVPAMSAEAEHVTMLQRSATYVVAVPGTDQLGVRLQRRLPAPVAHRMIRWKNLLFGMAIVQLSRRRPEVLKSMLHKRAVARLPVGFDMDTHLAPTYNPWDQRLCAAPDGDFFSAIRSGKADIVTDKIECLTRTGVLLTSGRELPADLVVTATGVNLLAIGGINLTVDGRDIDVSERLAYKGMMLAGVPNFSFTLGYSRASWTLRADLVAGYTCRLLRHLDLHGWSSVTPVDPGPVDRAQLAPLFDLQSGYVRRAASALPKQGPAAPWRLYQNYLRDRLMMRYGPVTDAVRFASGDDHDPERRGADAQLSV